MSDTAAFAPTPDLETLRGRVAALMPQTQTDLERLVRIPSVAFDGFPTEPVEEAAGAVADLLRRAGLPNVRLLDIPGAPHAVYGERPAAPGQPTVLLYAHYDVQPAGDEKLWTSPPFEPQVRDGRLYGRGAADDKSGDVLHAAAVQALGDDCRVGVKVLIEGQEEAGEGALEEWVMAHPDMVAADVIVMGDVGNAKIGVPTLTTSLRGMSALVVSVETLHDMVHSGQYGGAAPDALTALIRMLATLHDDAGTVVVPGLEGFAWHGAEYPEADLRVDAGVLDGVDLVGTGSVAERLWARPSITIVGLDAPAVDTASNSVVPRARAKVSARVAPGQDATAAHQALRRHLESVAPWHVRLDIVDDAPGDGFLAETGGPGYTVMTGAMKAAYGTDVVFAGEGGSIPLVTAFQKASPGAEIVLNGAEEPICKIHGPNESVSLEELERCILAEALFLAGMAR